MMNEYEALLLAVTALNDSNEDGSKEAATIVGDKAEAALTRLLNAERRMPDLNSAISDGIDALSAEDVSLKPEDYETEKEYRDARITREKHRITLGALNEALVNLLDDEQNRLLYHVNREIE